MLPPPHGFQSIPVLAKTSEAYKLWHEYLKRFPRTSHYSLGTKIDGLFTSLIETLIKAGYAPKDKKGPYIEQATALLDTLKFFIQTSWEMKLLDNNKYQTLSQPLHEIGKMLWGWNRYLDEKRPDVRRGV